MSIPLGILVLLIFLWNTAESMDSIVFQTAASYNPQHSIPQLPEEFVTNFMQHKWDYNGHRVSHVATGAIWHSFSRKMIRIDEVTHDWKSNNAIIGGPRTGIILMSVFDFNQTATTGQVVNTVFKIKNMTHSECKTHRLPLAHSSVQLYSADHLKKFNAGFTGQENLNIHGLSNKWVVFFGTTVATFYFDEHGNHVRMDFIRPPPDKASVTTHYFNMDTTPGVIPDDVFQGLTCRT